MKTLILLILLAGAFLYGYHLGRQPGSPDVIGWGQQVGQRVAEGGRHAAEAVRAVHAQTTEAAEAQDKP